MAKATKVQKRVEEEGAGEMGEGTCKRGGINPLAGAAVIAVALVLVFVLFGQGGSPAAPAQAGQAPAEEPGVEVHSTGSAASSGSGSGGAAPVPEAGETPPAQAEPAPLLSGLECSGDSVKGKITNVLEGQLLVEDIRVLFNGKVVDPVTLRCDKTVLASGESTTCASLQGVIPAQGESTVAVVIGEESAIETINC